MAMTSETRGFRAVLFVGVVGRFGVRSLIRFGFFRFRFVHLSDGYFVFFRGPVAQVSLPAACAAEREFFRRFRINGLLANGAFQFHGIIPNLLRFE